MMLEIAFWAQNQGSYEGAQKILKKINIELNDDTIRHVTNHIGRIIFDNDIKLADKNFKNNINLKNNKNGTIYIEVDGAAINTRIKNKDNTTWRENKLGVIFNTDNIKWRKNIKTGELEHEILKREYISYIGSAEKFIPLVLSVAIKNGYGKFKNTVILSDGATWIRNMVDDYFPDGQQILDFFHLCENVHKFAKLYIPKNEGVAKKWADIICKKLKNSETTNVLDKLKNIQMKYNIKFDLYQYISNNIKNIDYKSYIKNGFFIGSGAIESGNKVVLQTRLKRPGQRWNVETAQNMLTLRAKQESDLWYKEVVEPILAMYC